MQDLLRRFLDDGDEAAMERFVEASRRPLLRAARRIAPQFAEDAVQTAYHSLLRRGGVPPRPLAYLMTAVVRICYRHVAKQKRERELAARLERERPAEHRELHDEVDRLPPNYRDAIVLHYFEGLTAAEAGRLLGCSAEAVRQRLHRGRAALRSRLSYGVLLLLGTEGVMRKKAVAVVALLALLCGGVAWRVTQEASPSSRPRSAELSRVPGRESEPRSGAKAAAGDEREVAAKSAPAFATGIVLDESMAPLARVCVVQRGLEDSGSGRQPAWIVASDVRGVRTGADGRFELRRPIEDLQSLVFVKAGYACREAKAGREMRIVLAPGRAWSGVVRDTKGRPIAGVKVAAWQTGNEDGVSQLAYSDGEGRFRFEALGPNPAMAMVAHEGYGHRLLRSEGGELDVVLRRHSVIVDVADSAGRPLAAAGLLLRERESTLLRAAARTGYPSFRAVPGRLHVPVEQLPALSRGAAVNAILFVTASGHEPHRESVRLEKGTEPPHLEVRLRPGSKPKSITGRVVGPERVRVQLRAPAPEGFGVPADDDLALLFEADGPAFSFPALPPLSYRIVAKADGFATRSLEVVPPAATVTLEMQRAGSLEVHVRDSAGRPVEDRWVHADTPRDQRRVWHERTDKKGVARFAALPAGEFALYPFRTGGVVDAKAAGLERGAGRALVVAGGRVRAELVLPRRVKVTLEIARAGGAPLPGAVVRLDKRRGFALFGDRRQFLGGAAGAGGRLALDLYPGEYRAVVTVGQTRRGLPVTVSDDGGTLRLELALGDGVVHGRVADAGTGRPIPRRRVSVTRAGGGAWIAHSVTDETGRYELSDLPAGKLRIVVAGGSNEHGYRRADSPYPRAENSLELESGARREVDFALPVVHGKNALPKTVPVAVRVTDESGKPLPGAIAFAYGRFGATWIAAGHLKTGDDGRGEGRVIAAERYRVTVYGPSGKGRRWAAQTVERGRDELALDVALKPRE